MSRHYRIAVFGGDGIGPEGVAEGLKVLDAAEKRFGFTTMRKSYPYGAQHYLKTCEKGPDGKIVRGAKVRGTVRRSCPEAAASITNGSPRRSRPFRQRSTANRVSPTWAAVRPDILSRWSTTASNTG